MISENTQHDRGVFSGVNMRLSFYERLNFFIFFYILNFYFIQRKDHLKGLKNPVRTLIESN